MNNEIKAKSNKKKRIIIISIIVVALLLSIIGGIVITLLLGKNNKDDNNSTELNAWENAYILYLKGQVYTLNSGNNTDMQLIKIKDNQIPTLLVRYDYTYEGKTSKMLDIYQVNEEGNRIANGSTSGDCRLKILYNKENSKYEIFIYREYDESYVYTSLGEFLESAINDYEGKQEDEEIHISDYTFSKTNENSRKSVEEKFNEKFIDVDCDDIINNWVKYNKDDSKEDIIKLFKEEVEKNKTSESLLTEEKKTEILDKIEQEKKTLEENAKKEAEQKAKEEEEKNILTIGKYTLQYGKYTSDEIDNYGTITIILNADKTFSYSGIHPDGGSKTINQNGTYEIQLNEDDGYGNLVNWITLKLNDGTEAPFIVYGNNNFGSQWLSFKYSGQAINNNTNGTSIGNTTNVSSNSNVSSNTNSSTSENPNMPNAISKDEALKLAQNKWGTKSQETGYDIGYSYIAWIKDEQGMEYYVFILRWLVEDHWSFIDTVCISADGKTYKEIGMPVSYKNGEVVKQFDAEGNL